MTENDKAEILGKKPAPPLYYKFDDFGYKTTSKERVLSKIDELDRLTKGFEMGCITIWTGGTNAGKTTVMTMIAKQTILQNEKVFFFNGEQTKDDFKNNLYKQSVDSKNIYAKQYKDTMINDFYVEEKVRYKLDTIYGQNIFIYNNEAKRSIDFLIKAMEEVKKIYKVRVFILDNFMQIDTTSSDEYREQKDIMEKLRTFAVNEEVHIHLVVHQKKVEKNNPRITIYDVFGSSNLVNKAYNVISIIRTDNLDEENNEYKRLSSQLFKSHYDIKEVDSVLEVLKTKGIGCGLVPLKYDNITKTYREAPRITSERYDRLLHTQKKDNCPF